MQQEMTLDRHTELEKRQATSLFETAETIQINALNLARTKLPPEERDGQLARLLSRQEFLRDFRYALAQEIAQVIASFNQSVKAVYYFERVAEPKLRKEIFTKQADMTIQLLALVTSASDALVKFATNLNGALTELLSELPWNALATRSLLLNVVPVNEYEFKASLGYDVLLSSIDVQLQKIWERG